MEKNEVTNEVVKEVGTKLGVDWKSFDVDQFRCGMLVEFEHGNENELTNITNNDELITGKIALAHLREFPDYYDRLEKMEKEAKLFWSQNKQQ